MSHNTSILDTMIKLREEGSVIAPRGMRTLEILNHQFVVDYPFSSFVDRNFNMSYLKKEFMWYLSGDKYNTSILDASTMWEKFRQPEGYWFSNYGQYWFGPHVYDVKTDKYLSGFEWVLSQLIKDPDSRQAIIPMLSTRHLFNGNVDVVCTVYINFSIRGGKLNMTVRMRSSDIMWGYGNDLPCFWWLHEMMAFALGIERGAYTHSSDSLHVYERHFTMLEDICFGGMDGFFDIKYPAITDIDDLLRGEFKSDFGKWLKEV